MKQYLSFKSLVFAAALPLALGLSARADDNVIGKPNPASTDQSALTSGNLGLLGQKLGTLTYSGVDLDDTSVNVDRFGLEINEPLAFGFDGQFGYEFSESGDILGSKLKQHKLTAGVRAFSNNYNWGKPFVEAGLGHVWQRYAGSSDKSLLWQGGAGMELQVTPRLVVVPYGRYTDTPDLGGTSGVWSAGVRSSYWIDNHWTVTAGIERDDEQSTAFTVGTNFRF